MKRGQELGGNRVPLLAIILTAVCAFLIQQQIEARPAKASPASQGKVLYEAYQCASCHTLSGKGAIEGIELNDVGRIRSEQFVIEQLMDPENHMKKQMPKGMKYNPSLMPNMQVSRDEARKIYAYLKTISQGLRRQPVKKS